MKTGAIASLILQKRSEKVREVTLTFSTFYIFDLKIFLSLTLSSYTK
jgi:hypothetical protein